MIIYHNAFKGVFQYNLCPYMRIGQILDNFMTVVSIVHRDALLSGQSDINKHGNPPPRLNNTTEDTRIHLGSTLCS